MLEILIDKNQQERQIALVDNEKLVEYYIDEEKSTRKEGNIYIGVKLYYGAGDEKMYVGEVVDISEKVRMANGKTFRGVCLKMYGGSIEWKDRNEIILSGKWYVKSDDPALNN